MAAAVLGAGACATRALPEDRAATDESFAHLRTTLSVYEEEGFLVGPPDFPVVGGPVVFAAPGDSMFLGFAASMPPSALRFARENGYVAARYQVTMLVRDGADTLRRLDRREVVRVEDFAESTSRAPRIVFQRFVTVPARPVELLVTVRGLASRREATGTFRVRPPAGLSPPVLAYRAHRRASLAEPPSMLVSPRATAPVASPPPVVLVEGPTGSPGPVALSVEHSGVIVWADTIELEASGPGPAGGSGPPSAVTALPVHLLPAGAGTLRVQSPTSGTGREVPLYIGLSAEWAVPDWAEAAEYLAYALDADTLQAWREAAPEERAGLWRRFNARTDPVEETPANEFVARYFKRMAEANERYDEPGQAGWQTDRGEVYVKLGEPDRQRFVRPERQGRVPRIEWEYDDPSGRGVLVFEDATDFGVFVLTPRSRSVLRRLQRVRGPGYGDFAGPDPAAETP